MSASGSAGRSIRACMVRIAAKAALVVAERAPTAALEGHPAQPPVVLDFDDEIGVEKRAGRFELDLATEDGIFAEILHDVPGKLVLHGADDLLEGPGLGPLL